MIRWTAGHAARYAIVAGALLVAAGTFLWYRTRDEAPHDGRPGAAAGAGARNTSAVADEHVLLVEAARRRFRHIAPTGALAGMHPQDDPDTRALADVVAVEMLKRRLVMEKMAQDPLFKDTLEEQMRRRQPRLMRLKQTLADGFQAEQWVVVFDTTRCPLQDGRTEQVLVRDLEARFCMHPLLEYPGGFDASRTISLTVYPFEDIATRPEAEAQWSKGLLLEARDAIVAEFIEAYEKDGKLTF